MVLRQATLLLAPVSSRGRPNGSPAFYGAARGALTSGLFV